MSWYLCYLCGGTFLLPLSWIRTNESVPHMRADEKKRVLFGVIAGIIPEAKNKYEQHLTV